MEKNSHIDKFKFRENRSKTFFSMALILLLSLSGLLAIIPAANAHTPPQTLTTFAYIAAAANPVGVGQSVFLIMWVSPNPPTAIGIAGDLWRNLTVKITEPDGQITNLGPWYSDPTGSTYTTFTPTNRHIPA